MELKIRKGGPLSSDLYEMNFGGEKWYFVSERSMRFKGPVDLRRNLFDAMLIGLVATVKGAYNRTQKRLVVEL